MKRTLLCLLILSIFQTVSAQAINKKTLKTDCETYELNSGKIKIRINTEKIPFNLEKLEVRLSEPLTIPIKGCQNRLTITTPNSSIEAILSEKLNESYPEVNGSLLKIAITDLRILENKLPSVNTMLYASIDFLLKNEDESYSRVYSASDFFPIQQYIEKPLGKILTGVITEFYRKKLYINELSSLAEVGNTESVEKKGLYTNFKDLFKKTPTFKQIYSVKLDQTESFRTKYMLRDKNGLKVSAPILGFRDEVHTYLNIDYYYGKRYFVELSELNDSFYFIYDRIQDMNKGSKNTVAAGGGLLGSAVGSAMAGKKAPALIDRSTGEMICYERKTMKTLLSEKPKLFEEYKTLLNEEKRNDLFQFLKQLADSGIIK